MTLSTTLQLFSEYEEAILTFVEAHYCQLQRNWSCWQRDNPVPPAVIARLGRWDRVRYVDIASYRIVKVADANLDFQLIAPAVSTVDDSVKIQIEVAAINGMDAVSPHEKITGYQLNLVGVYHRIEPSCKQDEQNGDDLLLHFDYLIELAVQTAAVEDCQLPPLPKNFTQMTFIEARSMSAALADGPRLIGWESITGGIGLRHINTNAPLQTRIMFDDLQREWNLPLTCEALKRELQNLEFASLLLLNIAIGCVLERPRMSASIDDLLLLIGWRPHTRQERIAMRRKVWRWLLLFDSMTVHGRRPGRYRSKLTGKEFDLTSTDALIKVTGRRFQKDDFGNENHEIPLEVTWVAGDWLDQWRDNYQILNYFGDLRKIAAISTGKASGAWAQSIGLALHQYWRERAKSAEICHVGEQNQLSAKMAPFTRLELFRLFRCEPWVEDILYSDKPHRAKEYWAKAIRKLKVGNAGVIGHYRELDPLPVSREGWQEFWLKYQRLDIRPRGTDVEIIAQIARSNRRAMANSR